jgi:hypothetical protein
MSLEELVVGCREVLTNILHGGADGNQTDAAASCQYLTRLRRFVVKRGQNTN